MWDMAHCQVDTAPGGYAKLQDKSELPRRILPLTDMAQSRSVGIQVEMAFDEKGSSATGYGAHAMGDGPLEKLK